MFWITACAILLQGDKGGKMGKVRGGVTWWRVSQGGAACVDELTGSLFAGPELSIYHFLSDR